MVGNGDQVLVTIVKVLCHFLNTLSPSKKQATVYGKNLLTLEIDHFSEWLHNNFISVAPLETKTAALTHFGLETPKR